MTSAQSNTISITAENERLAALLRKSREILLASLANVAEETCRSHPAPGRWSVMDCMEHIAGAETFMLALLRDQRRPRSADAPNREQLFFDRVGNRTNKAEAPERGRPTGRFATLDAALKQFEASRAATILFTEQNTEDLRATEVTHPLFGNVSACELLIIMAKHAERHAQQIEEIKSVLSPQVRS